MRARSACLSVTLTLLATLAVAGVSRSAQAQTIPGHGFAIDKFEPSERGSEWFVLDSLDLRGKLRPAFGVVGEYSYRPFMIYNPDGTVSDSVVLNQFVVHPGASVVLFDRLRLAADMGLQLYAGGHNGVRQGTFYAAPENDQALGDLRFGADVRVFGEHGDAITGAVGGQIWAYTGAKRNWSSDGEVRLGPHVSVAGDISLFTYAARLGFTYRDRSEVIGDTQIGSELTYAASAGVRVADKKLVVGPEFFGSTVVERDGPFRRKSTPLEGLLGAHYSLDNGLRFGAGAGVGMSSALGSPVSRIMGSVEWAPSVTPSDRDQDGIVDDADACPDKPGVHTDDPKTNGCPPPPKDADRDGILDANDACVDVPGVATSDPKTNGCPPDGDQDGIVDALDACPTVPGVKSDDPLKNGCPADTDGDGVVDSADACPTTPGLKTDDPKTNGCPDTDPDKDGIKSDVDACPDQAGPADPDPKKNGCPRAVVQGGQIKILDQVKFKTGSAVIAKDKGNDDTLEAVLEVLKAHPEIAKLSVEGHTDNVGKAAFNKKLSASRAASVVTWLVAHGIDTARLSSAGFGPDRPIAPNDTPEGRQANRRVEFHIAEKPGTDASSSSAPQAAPKADAKSAADKPAAKKKMDGKKPASTTDALPLK